MNRLQQIHLFERAQCHKGFDLPARMSAVPLEGGGLALVSPLAIDAQQAEEIRALGDVRYLIAPNLLHHLHLTSAVAHFPEARLFGPEGLAAKRPDLTIHGLLSGPLPLDLAAALTVIRLEGAPMFDEYAMFHQASDTLILTDLVFHVLQPKGFVTNLVLFLNGCRKRLAVSRVWSIAVKNRTAMHESLGRVLALPFTRVILAHGENLDTDANARLTAALVARFGSPLSRMLRAPAEEV